MLSLCQTRHSRARERLGAGTILPLGAYLSDDTQSMLIPFGLAAGERGGTEGLGKVAAVAGEKGPAAEVRTCGGAARGPFEQRPFCRADSDWVLFMVWLRSATCPFAGNGRRVWQLLLPCNWDLDSLARYFCVSECFLIKTMQQEVFWGGKAEPVGLYSLGVFLCCG